MLLSARAGEESRVEGIQAGADDYLIKPFSARELLARVSGRLEIARMQAEGEQLYRELAESLEKQVRVRTGQLEHRTTELIKQSEEIRNLSAKLLQIQDEERRHIARELHDSAGQTLAVLGMTLAQLTQQAKAKAPEILEGEVSEQIVQQLQQEIRTASYLLHPPLLDENRLTSALGWYMQGLKERTALDISLEASERLRPHTEGYRVGRLPLGPGMFNQHSSSLWQQDGHDPAHSRGRHDRLGGSGWRSRHFTGKTGTASVWRLWRRNPWHARTHRPIFRDDEHRVQQ